MLQELRRRRPSRTAVPPTPSSARDDLEFSATVQGPRFFSTSLDCWALFTQSHDLDAVFTDSERREIALCFSRPAKSKCKVVLIRAALDRKSTRLNSSHLVISYAVFCLKKKIEHKHND